MGERKLNPEKCIDGECLYLDETTGEYYFTSPEPNHTLEMVILNILFSLIPFMLIYCFKLGGW